MGSELGPGNLALDKQHILITNNGLNGSSGTDIVLLIAKLYEKRLLIAGVTCFFTMLALIISLLLTPVYQVRTLIYKPNPNQIQELYNNTDSTISSQKLFTKFLKTLSNPNNYMLFLQESDLLNEALKNPKPASEIAKQTALNQLAKNYRVSIVHHTVQNIKDSYQDSSIEAELSTLSNKLDLTAKNNKDYLAFTNQKVLAEVAESERSITQRKINKIKRTLKLSEAEVANQRKNAIKRMLNEQSLIISELNNKIDALKKRDLRDKQLRLKELHEALQIATALGITGYISPQRATNHDLVIDLNSNKKDLYLRGTAYLKKAIMLTKAEKHSLKYNQQLSALQEQLYLAQNNKKIMALQNRTDDKPYVKEIEKHQKELARLQALSFNISKIKCFNMIGNPIVETKPIKPNKAILVIAAFLLSLLLTVFFIIIQHTINSQKIMRHDRV